VEPAANPAREWAGWDRWALLEAAAGKVVEESVVRVSAGLAVSDSQAA
jgi:hypothetical protein